MECFDEHRTAQQIFRDKYLSSEINSRIYILNMHGIPALSLFSLVAAATLKSIKAMDFCFFRVRNTDAKIFYFFVSVNSG